MLITLAIVVSGLLPSEPGNANVAVSAIWQAGATEDGGIAILDGADGAVAFSERRGAVCITGKEGAEPPAAYLYFSVADDRAAARSGPLYAVVEYFDESLGGVLQLEYDTGTGDDIPGRYRANEDQWGGWLAGSRKWRTAVFFLQGAGFAHRQNLGADFRIGGGPLFVRSVRIVAEKPDEACKTAAQVDESDIEPSVKIGPGGQFIVGGFDPARTDDALRMARALRGVAPALKSLGVTSHEGYVRWNLCEPEQGRYDWTVYDAFVEVYRQWHLKWVPFLIVGSPYSLPDWYYKKPGSQGYVCLEHGEESDVQSLWNPVLREHVARFIQAFCEHYRDTGVIESILLGITGNYGEAIYVATGNDWTADIHGQYHTHPGFWAGDPFAVADFRAWLGREYANAGALDAAWGVSVKDLSEVKPFLREAAPNDRAWLDFCDWYIGSMTEWARFWMKTTRAHFPEGDIYLCTGGHAPAEHGANFGDQCKAAAEIGGGVRITNEGSDYRANFSLTRWVASAGRQYGAYFSFEPAGAVDEHGVIARIYNATASGAKGLHYYYPNLFGTEAARENFIQWGAEFQQRTPLVEIAVYYPQTYIKLTDNKFLDQVQPLRDCFDFDYMSDEQIRDGGLDRVKALILLWGNVSEADVWQRIFEWVWAGGLIAYPEALGPLITVEGSEEFQAKFFGPGARLGKGRALVFPGDNARGPYRRFLAERLANAPELSKATRKMVAADGKEDGVFVSVCESPRRELLWFNYTPKEFRKGRATTVPPFSIVERKAP